MTDNIDETGRAWRLTMASAALALASAGCMTSDRYGGDPYDSQDPYDQGSYGS